MGVMRHGRKRSGSEGNTRKSLASSQESITKEDQNRGRFQSLTSQQGVVLTIKYPNGDQYEGEFMEVPNECTGDRESPRPSGKLSPRPKQSGAAKGQKGKCVASANDARVGGTRRIKHGTGSYFFNNGDKYLDACTVKAAFTGPWEMCTPVTSSGA